ncbi:hypothetical protein ACFQU7_30200 [Pseudoroseomonas wenyumeiae]
MLFDGKRAVGARLRRGHESLDVAAPLVIVSNGALHSLPCCCAAA